MIRAVEVFNLEEGEGRAKKGHIITHAHVRVCMQPEYLISLFLLPLRIYFFVKLAKIRFRYSSKVSISSEANPL